MSIQEKVEERIQTEQQEYSDLILLDLLHLDFKHFFKRYRTDFFGFLGVIGIIVLMILTLKLLASIGA